MVPAHGFVHGRGQEALCHVHRGGQGLGGRQLKQRLPGFGLARWRVLAFKSFRHGQPVVAHVQQDELRMQRHRQPGGVGQRAVGDGIKIGQHDKGGSHGSREKRWENEKTGEH